LENQSQFALFESFYKYITDVVLQPIETKVSNKAKKTKPPAKPKKAKIPATLKRLVWNKYIGEDIGKSKCKCCNVTDITQMAFNCGHIIADVNGGELTLDNLLPICQNCNSSMGTMNMDDFKSKHKL
jgi:5-methylcytosine-specific restriction endonuclease McrA